MKLLQLFERRIQKTQIMYHGTSSDILDNILKHGLLANPPYRIHNAYPKVIDGVYLSPRLSYAQNLAAAVSGGRSRPMLIKVQYTKGSSYIDPDVVLPILYGYPRKLIGQMNIQMPQKGEKIVLDPKTKKYLLKIIIPHVIQGYKTKIGIPNKRAVEATKFIVDKSLDILFDNSSYPDWKLPYDILSSDPEIREKQKEIYSGFKKNNDKSKVAYPYDIKFKGKTKILGIQILGEPPVYGNEELWDESLLGHEDEEDY